jgi:hypothetical protein
MTCFLVQDMQALMMSNDWQHDPLSQGDAANAIAARWDLSIAGPEAGGAIDAKITSSVLMAAGNVSAISGPTHEQQAVFSWDPTWSDVPHQGQPETWDFDWVMFDSA